MRRIAIWLASTVTIVVLLFGYHTSTNQASQSIGSSSIGGTTTSGSTSGGSSGAGAPPEGSGHRYSRGDDDSGSSDDDAGSGSSGTLSGGGSSNSSGSNPGSSAGSNSGTSGSSGSNAGNKTYTGAVVQTMWGPVQVQITVNSGKITNVNLLQYPNGNGHDAQINSYAVPILVQETISKQTAKIDMVGGATVTSTGYVQSLQSALDQAGI